MMQIKIDPELQAMIPPLTQSEKDDLERQILESGGPIEPLIVWKNGRDVVLVDGHNRYAICTKHGLPFRTSAQPFASKDAVKHWMFEHQIARRNLSTDQLVVLAALRGISTTRGTVLARRQAAEIVSHGAADKVLSGGYTIARAYNEIHPRQPVTRAPATAVPVATPVERAESREAASEARKLQTQLVEAERAADFWTRLRTVPSVDVATSRNKSGLRPATPVTVASDWHFGEVVTLEETLGRNEYNLAEAHRRAANFWDHVMWLRADIKRSNSADDHVLILAGDMISGNIHPELMETNEVPLADQVSECAAAILPGVRALAADCRRLIVPCVAGNHARITDKSRIKTGWANSLETMLYRFLKESTKDLENVEWIIPKAEHVAIDVMGHRVQIQHGTHIKSQGGIGGVLVPLNRWATKAASAQYYVFGHFHQAQWFDSVIVNGSLIGDSAYSRVNAMTFRAPEQVNFTIDEKRGLRRFDPVSVT